jgi:hypothetical protein
MMAQAHRLPTMDLPMTADLLVDLMIVVDLVAVFAIDF